MNRLVGYLRRAALGQDTMVTDEVTYFGMRYIVPVMVDSLGVILAVNVGGAVIPTLLSTYLLSKNRLWRRGLIAIVCVAAICHALAPPVNGVGIALPIFRPPLVAAITAAIVSWRHAAPLAYAGGTLGVLIGADRFCWQGLPAEGRRGEMFEAPHTTRAVLLSQVRPLLTRMRRVPFPSRVPGENSL